MSPRATEKSVSLSFCQLNEEETSWMKRNAELDRLNGPMEEKGSLPFPRDPYRDMGHQGAIHKQVVASESVLPETFWKFSLVPPICHTRRTRIRYRGVHLGCSPRGAPTRE